MFGVGLATVAHKRYPAAMQDEWYKNWFDTPYYAMLYQHRDVREAQMLIDNLVHHLQVPPQAHVLDLADGVLAGTVAEPILDRDTKLATLRRLCAERGLPLSAACTVGDGANDWSRRLKVRNASESVCRLRNWLAG